MDKTIGDTILESISPEAQEVLRHAANLDRRGDKASALLLRNVAWRMENGREWLDDINLKEVSQ
jgi:hypothetical protein